MEQHQDDTDSPRRDDMNQGRQLTLKAQQISQDLAKWSRSRKYSKVLLKKQGGRGNITVLFSSPAWKGCCAAGKAIKSRSVKTSETPRLLAPTVPSKLDHVKKSRLFLRRVPEPPKCLLSKEILSRGCWEKVAQQIEAVAPEVVN